MTSIMLFPLFCIHALIILCSSGLTSCFVRDNHTDYLALLDFKAKITHDPFKALSSWNNSVHFCKWYGVTCGLRHQRVTKLILEHQKLTGSISQHIGNLSFLRELNIFNNSFYNQIPSEVGGLRRLQILQLQNNIITGKIPSNISACFNLIELDVGDNHLVGKIPVELGLLLKLRILVIQDNHLTGNMPSSLGNLSSLQELYMLGNNITGRIPDIFTKLPNIRLVAVGLNNFTGTIPRSLFNHSVLQHFNAPENQLQGILPWDLGITLPNLKHFDVTSNQFTGPIPITLSDALNLEEFGIAGNQFTGKVPSLEKLQKLHWFAVDHNFLGNGEAGELDFICSMSNATNLGRLTLQQNNLGGVLPECIGNLSVNLRIFAIEANKVYGSIPTQFGNFTSLEVLGLRLNSFTGTIPSNIGNLSKLKVLTLDENKLSQSIPLSFGNLTMLTHLYLDHNNLEGNIPSSLGRCQNLLFLYLHSNNLTGTIPSQLTDISSLVYLDLSQNSLMGPLPVEIGKLKPLSYLDVSYNMLFGEIPNNLGSCISLEGLYLEDNSLQGSIPSTLRSLRALQELDISNNNFSGEIPEFLEGLSLLTYLNLSYNNLEGKVPTRGVFGNATATSLMGNQGLCGGIPKFKLRVCEANKYRKERLTFRAKLVIGVLAGVSSITFVLSFLCCWYRKKREVLGSSDSNDLLMRLSYQDLYNATNGFSTTNLIGMGSFGTVYKGTLDQGATYVAIKVMNLQYRGAPRSFVAECIALRNVRHRNLLKVITACSTIDYQGNDFRALVYEFMVNGSLDDWLHPDSGVGEADTLTRKLKLLQRLNIGIDVACALDYLHHHCVPPIAHCDLKPSNVLLDSELTGHVGDFGLARFIQDATQNLSVNQSSSVGIRGTIGYTAPEYGMGSEISTYGDVYSYGIMLLEMITNKMPTHDMFKEEMSLHNFVKEALPERVPEILDPIIIRELREEENGILNYHEQDVIQECLISILEIGVHCSVDLPTERMNISDAIGQLHSIKQKLLQNGISIE